MIGSSITFAALTSLSGFTTNASAQECFLGEIRQFGFNFAPRGYALAQGQILPINQNQSLYSLYGTTYGGDGRTSFALPDLRGRSAMGVGTGPGLSPASLGSKKGIVGTVLKAENLPSHTHSATTATVINANGSRGNSSSPTGNVISDGNRDDLYQSADPIVPMAPTSAVSVTSISPAGGGDPSNNRQPYLGTNYSVCIQGLFPSRN